MIYRLLTAILLTVTTALGAEGRILKVLPHFLDAKGRHALSPSLFERDAYQLFLRENSEQIAALRYDIQWKGKDLPGQVTLKLEIRSSATGVDKARVFQTEVKPRRFLSNWSTIQLDKSEYEKLGQVIAWRASLWDGAEKLADLESFLW